MEHTNNDDTNRVQNVHIDLVQALAHLFEKGRLALLLRL